MLNRLIFCLSIVLLFASRTSAGPQDIKILEWGWDTPSPVQVRDRILAMEKLPFDGVVLNLFADGHQDRTKKVDRQASFTSRDWGNKTLRREDFSESIAALKGTEFGRFTDDFLTLDVTPGNVDWFDDDAFANVVANARLLASVCKETHMRGIMFDTEAYDQQLFNYARQKNAATHSLAEYQQQAGRRGGQIMRAINAEYPGIRIIVTLAYSVGQGETDKYGLLPALLDGMLEAADEKTILYDGWESSYNYLTEKQFAAARKIIRQQSLQWSAVPDAMRQHWRASFGLWIDYGEQAVWNQQDFSKNFFSPQQFGNSVAEAMRNSDGYVWIYTHHADWWDGQVPQAYIQAMEKARSNQQ